MAEIQGSVERWGRYAIRSWRQALTYRAYVPATGHLSLLESPNDVAPLLSRHFSECAPRSRGESNHGTSSH